MGRIEKIGEELAGLESAVAGVQKAIKRLNDIVRGYNRPDFSEIKDGEYFSYRGIDFIRLGKEQGGVLCITARPYYHDERFSVDGNNDWKSSDIRKKLNIEFLRLISTDDLLSYRSNLTADNGDADYGFSNDCVGLLSCDLYRKYRKYIPKCDGWVWTCTAWRCLHPDRDRRVRVFTPDNVFAIVGANSKGSVFPAVIFSNS